MCILDGYYADTCGLASRNHGISFHFGGRDEGMPLAHPIIQTRKILTWSMAVLNTWSIKITARSQVYSPTPSPETVALHCLTKQWFGWLFLKISLCSLAFGKMNNNKHQYFKNICKLRKLYAFHPSFLFLPKGFKVGWLLWYIVSLSSVPALP